METRKVKSERKEKRMKKIMYAISIITIAFLLVGCGKEEIQSKNIEGTLPEIMEKLYEGISEEEKPMMLDNITLTEENFEYFAFTKANYKEAIASEGISSMAHSVVLIRLENENEANQIVEDIKKNANPRKWICVEAENTYVLSKGDLVVLIMSNELAPKIKTNFENLK